MTKIRVKITEVGERLDSFLSKQQDKLSRNQIQKMIRIGEVLLNGKIAKSSLILKQDDLISYNLPKTKTLPQPERGDIKIIFENDDFLIIDKPTNLVVHPAHANTEGTLVNFLLNLRPEIKQAVYDPNKIISRERPGIVHRLDKDTSGLLIVAKNEISLKKLSDLIHDHKLNKKYTALVHGWPEETGEIKNFLQRSTKDRRQMSIHSTIGKEAITVYSVIKYLKFSSLHLALLSLKPITGRTHQLRIHLKSIGHPIVGDPVYSTTSSQQISHKLGAKRQMLHASELGFSYNGKAYNFQSELPNDLNNILSKLEKVK